MVIFPEEIRSDSDTSKYVLKFDPAEKLHVIKNSSIRKMCFIGDTEDYLNLKMKNFKSLNSKYKVNMDVFVAADHYTEFKRDGNAIYGCMYSENKKNLMPYGIYQMVNLSMGPTGFKTITINSDEFIEFENSEVSNFQKTLRKFFNSAELFKKLRTRHKGATLLYGPPGSGKSTQIVSAVKDLSHDTYCIFLDKSMSLSSLLDFKEYFKDHKVIIVLEEITERAGGGTEDLLNFLDGYGSWENCYVIATTNYPEALPANLADRPGRFNQIIEVPFPSEAQKVKYLLSKGFTQEQIDEVLPKTKDFSLDHISAIAIQSQIHGVTLGEYIEILAKTKQKVKTAFKGKSNMGIG